MSPESFEQIINDRLIEGADVRRDFARASTERVHRGSRRPGGLPWTGE